MEIWRTNSKFTHCQTKAHRKKKREEKKKKEKLKHYVLVSIVKQQFSMWIDQLVDRTEEKHVVVIAENDSNKLQGVFFERLRAIIVGCAVAYGGVVTVDGWPVGNDIPINNLASVCGVGRRFFEKPRKTIR